MKLSLPEFLRHNSIMHKGMQLRYAVGKQDLGLVTITVQLFHLSKRLFQEKSSSRSDMAKSMQPLSKFNILSSENVDEARSTMAGIYGDLKLDPLGRSDSFGLRLSAAPLGRLLITSMRWEGGIRVHTVRNFLWNVAVIRDIPIPRQDGKACGLS